MIKIKENGILVNGHLFAIRGIMNEEADSSVVYDPSTKKFITDVWGYQIGEDSDELIHKEISLDDFENFYNNIICKI